MKKMLCLALALLIVGSCALAAGVPQLSGGLMSAAKQAAVCLASGEYERMVTLLPFSGVAPSATEWESFSRNYAHLGSAQRDYAVAYWKSGGWRIAVPIQEPSGGGVEVLLLHSEDGSSFDGYKYATWSEVEKAYQASDHVLWDREYIGHSAKVLPD